MACITSSEKVQDDRYKLEARAGRIDTESRGSYHGVDGRFGATAWSYLALFRAQSQLSCRHGLSNNPIHGACPGLRTADDNHTYLVPDIYRGTTSWQTRHASNHRLIIIYSALPAIPTLKPFGSGFGCIFLRNIHASDSISRLHTVPNRLSLNPYLCSSHTVN
jgi:hypothetical protein